MGISASGHLFFGVYYGEEDPRWPEGEYGREMPDEWDEDTDEDWEDWLAKGAGLADPYSDPIVETMPERDYSDRSLTYAQRDAKYTAEREAWDIENADWVARRDAYWAAKQQLVEACPIELITVGHHDYPLKALILRGTHMYDSHEGCEVDFDALRAIVGEKLIQAEQWCEQYGIDWKDPKWLLTGSMG